ncbi:hypothetical protein BBJ28_00023688 [Nothophytophthora sp. Chile5]|nr:hypothetical protein BBJ28_00023688 [Nothophytophthora sp. Chile5]
MANVTVDLTEAMLVVPALGVKLSKRRRNGATSSEVRTYSHESGGFCLLSKLSVVSQFVDLSTICAVAVNEAITFSNVVNSLVFMVQGQQEMLLPFELTALLPCLDAGWVMEQTFRPRIAVLQEIYRETKTLLFPDEDGGRKMHLPEEIAPASS